MQPLPCPPASVRLGAFDLEILIRSRRQFLFSRQQLAEFVILQLARKLLPQVKAIKFSRLTCDCVSARNSTSRTSSSRARCSMNSVMRLGSHLSESVPALALNTGNAHHTATARASRRYS